MLQAQKLQLINEVKQNALNISERELRFFSISTMNVSTQSAILLGIIFQGLVSLNSESDIPYIQFFFVLVTVAAMLI